ncbi:MAG: amino acid permease [Acidobacteria bacterium]|nr:amino acid permease [Acidobacteriota bacterium]MCA1651741.1 amino acid permease [Acidobacteriota bacterium]
MTNENAGAAQLERGMGLLQATATNMLGMIGVGPFLTLPFMITAMGGPHILYPWLAGAVLALCDGLVYAQFAAALPGSGGPYVYLREAYKPFSLGRLLSFMFIFQVIVIGPLGIASGAVGFADYLGFYWQTMGPLQHNLIAAAVCIAVTAMLYRNIEAIGRLSVVLLGVVLLTVGWVIVAGLFRFSPAQAFAFPPEAFVFDRDLFAKIGAASILAMYNYGGYNQVCNIGEEIRNPRKTMPRAIVLSIVLVVLIYVVMTIVVLGMIPWQEAQQTRTIASVFIQRTFSDPAQGRIAGVIMNALILFVTASSLYAFILGYSRIPFAAARDGQFFKVFAKVHSTKHFPHVSLLTIGALAIPFCFLTLGQILNWLILVQILQQFIWQCAGVILLRRYRKDIPQPFTMWLYPVPALVSLGLWLYIFFTGPVAGMLFAVSFLLVSVAAHYLFVGRTRTPSAGV